MRIAILGATSQIAKDLVCSFAAEGNYELVLYARRPDAIDRWLTSIGLIGRYTVAEFAGFTADQYFDAIINFVGVGDPARAVAMGADIVDVTLHYDELALNYLRRRPDCRYIFLSSGAAYGSNFDMPAHENTKATIAINNFQPEDWYTAAKLHAEVRHRARVDAAIIDLRVFSYFSRTQDLAARFFLTDLLRAIQAGETVRVSSDYIVRDFLNPVDFNQLVRRVLVAPPANEAIDCYTSAPVDKPTLLQALQERFSLCYEIAPADKGVAVNATGAKAHYYSVNRRAETFGYVPVHSSLTGVIEETSALLAG